MEQRRLPVRELFAIAAITAVAVALRLHELGARPIWSDEAVSLALARLGWSDFARIAWKYEANMTLYYLLLAPWLRLGDSEAWVRGLSVVFGAATIPAVWWVGRKAIGTSVGLIAASLLALNAFHVRYSQEARAYSLLALLTTVSAIALLSAAHRPSRGRWLRFAGIAAAAMYAQLYAALGAVAHLLWTKRTLRLRVRYAAVAFLLITAPLWIFVATTGTLPIAWVPRPNPARIWAFLTAFTGNFGLPLVLAYAAAITLAVVRRERFDAAPRAARGTVTAAAAVSLFTWWLAFPILLTLAVSFVKPIFVPRYMAVALPALALLAAVGIVSLRRVWAVGLAVAALCALSFAGVLRHYAEPMETNPQDWRAIVRSVRQQAGEGDAILFYVPQGRFPFDYYYGRVPNSPPLTVLHPAGQTYTWRTFAGQPDVAEVERWLQTVTAEPEHGLMQPPETRDVLFLLLYTRPNDRVAMGTHELLSRYLPCVRVEEFGEARLLHYRRCVTGPSGGVR